MKKILFIVDAIDNGGVGVVLRNLLKFIDKNKYRIDVLTFEKNDVYERLMPKEVSIRHLYNNNPAKSKSRIKRYAYSVLKNVLPRWFIRFFAIKDKYDLAIDFKGNNLNVLVTAKCPRVFWSHKDFSTETNLVEKEMVETYSKTNRGTFKDRIFKKQINQLNHIVCISNYTKNAFIDRWHPNIPISVVHNVIDSESVIEKSKEEIEYKKPLNKIVFCCVSRISKGKGIERLLECVEELNQQGFLFELNIVGGGDAFNDIKCKFDLMNLPNVKLLGNKDNPFPFLRESDIFVCPSETECYSTVLCEAISLGKPVIMTNVGASEEIMSFGNFGLLVSNSKDGVFFGMKTFLEKPQLIKTFSNNFDLGDSPFDTRKNVNEAETLIDSLLC